VTEDNTCRFADMMVQRCKYPSISKEGDSITQFDVNTGEVPNDDYGQVDTTIQGAELQ